MKNYYKQIIIIVVLLVLIGSGLLYIKKLENPNNDNKKNNSNKYVTLVNMNKNENKITQEFEVDLNGQKNKMTIEYTYNEEANDIIGTYDNYKVAVLDYEAGGDNFTEDNIKTLINENSFQTIKGTDNKDYLLFIGKGFLFPEDKKTTDFVNMFVLNDKLEVISKELGNGSFEYLKLYDIPCKFQNEKVEYSNSLNVELLNLDEYEIRFKIEDNKINYLSLVSVDDNLVIEEKVFTINNDKLEENVINRYNVLELCKQS